MHNVGALKQQLWGLELEGPCDVGDEVFAAAEDGGKPLRLHRSCNRFAACGASRPLAGWSHASQCSIG